MTFIASRDVLVHAVSDPRSSVPKQPRSQGETASLPGLEQPGGCAGEPAGAFVLLVLPSSVWINVSLR